MSAVGSWADSVPACLRIQASVLEMRRGKAMQCDGHDDEWTSISGIQFQITRHVDQSRKTYHQTTIFGVKTPLRKAFRPSFDDEIL